LFRRWSEASRFFNAYGPTENTVCATATREAEVGIPSIGYPITGVDTWLLNDNLQLTPLGGVGEIHLGGKGLARGYLGQPGKTAAAFVPNPFGQPGSRLYKTGDLGRYLPDGRLQYLGRADGQVKLRGYRIELGEVEGVLASQPGVAGAVAQIIAKEVEPRLVLFYLNEPGQLVPLPELKARAAANLPPFMLPSEYVCLEEFPRTPSGKVDRAALRVPGRKTQRAHVPPGNQVEANLVQMAKNLLEVEEIGIQDNLLEMGGSSLLLVQAAARINALYGVELPLEELFENATIEWAALRIQELVLEKVT